MKKKGAELLSIFLISMLVFCSFSVPALASDNYDPSLYNFNDSVVNRKSTENKQLYFIPLAPPSRYHNYVILEYENVIYLILCENSIDFYGDCIYSPGTDELEFYQLDNSSNNWVACDVPSLPRWNLDTSRVAFWGCTYIDCTFPKMHWMLARPYDDTVIRNQRTGYHIYWNLTIILLQILSFVDYYAQLIMQHELLIYLCVTALVGELFVFIVLLLRRVGDIRNEEVNM